MNNNTRTQSHRRESDPGQALSRRQVLKGAGALAGSALAAPSLLRGKLRHPNVLLIIADDLAAWMTGCYGNQLISTPHIDRLAAAGTRFEKLRDPGGYINWRLRCSGMIASGRI